MLTTAVRRTLRLAAWLTGPLLLSGNAHATTDAPTRHIQISPSNSTWMSEAAVEALSSGLHAAGHCGGFMDVTDDPQFFMTAIPSDASELRGRSTLYPTQINAMLPSLDAGKIHQNVEKLSSYHDRYYKNQTGVDAAQWIADTFKSMAEGRSDVTIEMVTHRFAQPSVIVRIAGTGDTANESIVLGGHEDSVNWQAIIPNGRLRAPGADDNASGVATLLEVFRVLMENDYHPQRTVEFMTYAGEELGLLGSQDIARSYRAANRQVKAVMQFDMNMYPSVTKKLTFITDNVNKDLTAFTERLMDAYVTEVPWQESSCGYACSDHASWDKVGYPAVFPFEAAEHEMNPQIHTTRDTLDNALDAGFALHFAKLALAYAVELGGIATP